MKIIRFLFFIFLLAAAFGVVGIFLMLTPTGQTWVVQSRLDHPEGWHGNVGSFWAFFGKLQIDDLRLQRHGYTLTVPHVEAKLPVIQALVWRNFAVKQLAAKGWTLDLTGIPDPNTLDAAQSVSGKEARPTPAPAEADDSITEKQNAAEPTEVSDEAALKKEAEFVFRGVLDAWKLPGRLSLDEAELEGDVLLNAGAGEKPNMVHVKITGGGMRLGAAGKFEITAGTSMLNLQRDPMFVDGTGELLASPRADGTWENLVLTAKVDLKGGSFPDQLELTGNASATRRKNAEGYDLALGRNGRPVLSAQLSFAKGAHQLAGDWKLTWQHEDSALLWSDHPWPSLAAQGGGRIEIADTFRSTRVVGALQTEMTNLGKLYPSLKHLPALPLAVSLDATAMGPTLHVERLKVAEVEEHPVLSADLVGPININWADGTWQPAQPGQSDLAQLAVNHYELKWLTAMLGGWRFAHGDASGEILIKASKDRFSFHSKAPLLAEQIIFLRGDNVIADEVSASASLSGEYTADTWKLQLAPVTVTRDGKTLLTFSASQEKEAADKPVKIDASWQADIAADPKAPAAASTGPIVLRKVEGNFFGRIDPTLRGDGSTTFVGRTPDETLKVQYGLTVADNGTVSLRAPISLARGKRKTEIVVDGNYAHTSEGHGLDATVSGSTVDLDQLEWLMSQVGQLSRFDSSPGSDLENATQPFWQDWFGNFTVAINQLDVGDSVFKEIGGVVSLTSQGLKLSYGHYVGADLLNVPVTGELTFQPKRANVYEASGSVGARQFDAKPFFAQPKGEEDPVFEGKFSVETSFSSSGKDWPELLAHARKEYHLSSSGGIVRLLKVDVADAIPQPGSVVSDSASSVGNAVGKVFGRRGFGSGEVKLPKHTQAVIDFTLDTSEILYKQIQITATQDADQNIHVSRIELQAEDEHLVGTGDLTHVEGKPIAAWPLHFDFKFGARGKLIDSLEAAHLLSGEKDSAGYELINGDAKFVGSIQKFDASPWHDFLAAAATAKLPDQKAPESKKDGRSSKSKK